MVTKRTDTDSPTVLVINPGSTSTKVALFRGEVMEGEGMEQAPDSRDLELWEELEPRLEGVRAWMRSAGIAPTEFDAVVGRVGLLRPLPGGTYRVSEAMVADARAGRQGMHASNLGCALADAVAAEATRAREGGEGDALTSRDPVPAFVVDPVSTDEFLPLARFSGLEGVPRRSLSHALSIHAVVRQVCRRDGIDLDDTRFVVGHLGGGISICPVDGGRILDANNANSAGPFSPTRAGGLPTQEVLELAFSGDRSLKELRELTLRRGGLVSYLGTSDAREVEARIESGDEGAREVFEAMAYQIAKEIGAMATVLHGRVDRILLTGGLAGSRLLTGWIRDRVEYIAPVESWPKVEEMRALAEGAIRVLRGQEEAREY